MELVSGKRLRKGNYKINGNGTLLLDYGKKRIEVYFIQNETEVYLFESAKIRAEGKLMANKTTKKEA